MAFLPTMIFAAGYPTGASGAVLQGVQTNLPVTVTFQGTSTAPIGAIDVINQEIEVIHEPFQLSNGNRVDLTTITADLTFDWDRYNALIDTAKHALLQAFAAGNRLSLAVAIDGVPGEPILTVELRILKTTDYLINPGATVFAQPAHSPATSAPNLVVPGAGGGVAADNVANYTYSTPGGELGAGALTANANGRLTVTASSAPANVGNRLLRVQAAGVPSVGGSVTATADLTMDLHLPTEVVVQLDRSGSMNAITTGTTTKWDAAKDAANLFSHLYGTAIPDLSGPNTTVLNSKQITMGRFTWPGAISIVYTPAMGLDNASAQPQVPAAETAEGGTPIGQALFESTAKYTTTDAPGWRRRQIVLLTDGMHNSGSPNLTAPATDVDTLTAHPETGVIIHAISYALTGETATTTLDALSAAHGGLLLGSESDADELDPEKLRDKFIDILGTIIPINRNGSLDAPSGSILVDDGVDRVIFVAPGGGGLTVTPPAGTPTITTGTGNGISWAAVDAPRQGTWTLAPAGMAILDLALMLRCSLEPQGVGQPVTVRAELDFHGQPVSGATIRVRVRRPGESAGEVITAFVRAGGLFSLLQSTALGSVASSASVDVPGAVTRGKPIAAATAAVGFDVHKNGDTQSLRRTLLEAAEKARGLALEKASDDLTLSEVSPGVYEAVLGATFTQEDGLYTFEFHAEGTTPTGAAFARDQSRCSTLAPVPSPLHSQTVLEQLAVVDAGVTWSATVYPRTATDRALGPGLGYMLGFAWVDEATRKELGPVVTVDNLDGSYSATVRLPQGHKFPGLGLYTTGVRGSDDSHPVIVTDKSEDARFVTLTLDRIRVIDPKDHCLHGKGELSFDVVVAPGGSPSRAVRTRVPERGVLKMGANDFFEPALKIYEGFVEPGSLISITMGGTEFDWFLFFKREEKLARYHRTLSPELGVHKFAPGDESNDPESLSDWQVWYTLEVE